MMSTVADRPTTRRTRVRADAGQVGDPRRAAPARRRAAVDKKPERNPVTADVMAILASFGLQD